MCDGSTHERGPHKESIQRGLTWLKDKGTRQKDGFMSAFDSTGMGNVFEHGTAVLALAHLYGMVKESDSSEIKEKLKLGVRLLEKMQNSDGGWPKIPNGGQSDPGVTAMCYMAMRAAARSGVQSDKADLKKLKKLAKTGSSIQDMYGAPIYTTGAYLRILYGLGYKDDEDTQKILKSVVKFNHNYRGGGLSEWDYVGFYFATAALFHDEKSDDWKTWYKNTRDYLIKSQIKEGKEKGYWIIQYCLNCKVFATDLALLCLMMPERLLPVNEY